MGFDASWVGLSVDFDAGWVKYGLCWFEYGFDVGWVALVVGLMWVKLD